MASHVRISGPLFVKPEYREGRHRFLLLLSNLSGTAVNGIVQVYAASFSGLETPVTWIRIVDEEFSLASGLTETIEVKVDRTFEYYQFHVENSLPNTCFHPSLYLLAKKLNPLCDSPLVKGNEWEIKEE